VASGCFIAGDDFQRADNDDIGAGWVENPGGGWAILGNALTTAVPNDLAVFQTPHPDAMPSMLAWADVKGSADGDTLRVIIAWEDDDNYLWSELEVDAACGMLRLWQRKAAANTLLREMPINGALLGQWHKLYACYDPEAGVYGDSGRFEGRVETASLSWYTVAEDVVAIGTYAGLGTGALTGTATFDDFELWKEQTEDDPECPTCKQGTTSCEISADSFDRPNSTDLGCLWEEMVLGGAWAISANSLIDTTPDDLVRHTVGHPDGESNLWARVLAKGWDVGDVMRLVIAYADVDNYCWVELECGTACGVLRLWQRLLGVNTQLGTDTPVDGVTIEQWTTLEACYRSATASYDGRLFGKVTTAAGSTVSTAAECDAVGTMAGLGTGAITSHVLFDDFELEKLHSEANPECRTCEATDTCVIYHDNFNRSGGSDLGCNWTAASGSPQMTGAMMEFFAPGVALCDVRHPDADVPSMQFVQVNFGMTGLRTAGVNGVARVYVGWLSSAEHHYVELALEYVPHPTQPAFDGAIAWTRCFRVSGGVATQVGSSSYTSFFWGPFNSHNGQFTVCYLGSEIRASVSTLGGVDTETWTTTDSGGRHVAIGAGPGAYERVQFDAFEFERHQTAEWEECRSCPREVSCNDCSNSAGPQMVRIAVTGAQNRSPAICNCCDAVNGSGVVSLAQATSCSDFPWDVGQVPDVDYERAAFPRCCWTDAYWHPSTAPWFQVLTATVGVVIVRLLPSGVWQVRGQVVINCNGFGGGIEWHQFKVDVGTTRPNCDSWYRFEIPWWRCYNTVPGGCDGCDFTNAKILVTAI
jgi:hypothetical protein